jgi:hypothetical protein
MLIFFSLSQPEGLKERGRGRGRDRERELGKNYVTIYYGY